MRFDWKLLWKLPASFWDFVKLFILQKPTTTKLAWFLQDVFFMIIAIPCAIILFIFGLVLAIILNVIGRADLMAKY